MNTWIKHIFLYLADREKHTWACLPSSCQAKSQQYCRPEGPTASIFYGIWIKQSVALVFVVNLDKVLLKKLFPTMNI